MKKKLHPVNFMLLSSERFTGIQFIEKFEEKSTTGTNICRLYSLNLAVAKPWMALPQFSQSRHCNHRDENYVQ